LENSINFLFFCEASFSIEGDDFRLNSPAPGREL